MSADHERIWLQNAEDAREQDTGRMWCEDKVWPDDGEDGEPTEYVRADLYEAARTRATALEKALERFAGVFQSEHAHLPDDTPVAVRHELLLDLTLTLGDFRAARAALSPKLGEEKR